MKKIIATALLTLCVFTANAGVIFTDGLVNPQTVRDNVTLTHYGDLELRYNSDGVWAGFSNLFAKSNVIVFDIPITEFQFNSRISTINNSSFQAGYDMSQAFNLNNFEGAIFNSEDFDQFAFVLFGYNDPTYKDFVAEPLFLENVFIGSYSNNQPSTDVNAPATASIFALGIFALLRHRKNKKQTH